jgi:hypothetical protein
LDTLQDTAIYQVEIKKLVLNKKPIASFSSIQSSASSTISSIADLSSSLSTGLDK